MKYYYQRHIDMSAISWYFDLSLYQISGVREFLKRPTNSRRSFFAWHEHANTSPTFYATDPFSPARSTYCNRNPFPPCVRHGRRFTPIKTARCVDRCNKCIGRSGRFDPCEFCLTTFYITGLFRDKFSYTSQKLRRSRVKKSFNQK